LIAAALSLAVTAIVFVLAYAHMRDDADDSAAGADAARSAALTRSAASGREAGSDSGKPAPAVRLAAQPSR
jgi:hypothetical protein